jgi:hypothetical protein
MAQLVRIGPHDKNGNGHTSKGYGIYSRGRKTIQVWGPVESIGARRGNHFRWRSSHGGPERTEKQTHSSIEEAKGDVAKMKKIRQWHKYQPLKTGDRIRRGRRARS